MWLESQKPILALAPLADITDGPFCRTLREFANADFIIFREMTSAEGIVRDNKKTLKMCQFDEIERPIVQQIFGSDPETMAEAARIIMKKFRPDGIDINMGCPVPKIAQKFGAGAALMKDHGRAVKIVEALKSANLGVPISVKTRLGWSDPKEILEFAPKLEAAGADLLSIHGRTQKQGYAGEADWPTIGEVKKIISIPVLANGDIDSLENFSRCLEITGADGAMIGRGAISNPWIFRQIQCLVPRVLNIEKSKTYPSLRIGGATEGTARPLNIEKQVEFILSHARRHVEHYGERGILAFRKYFGYYLKGVPGAKELRQKLVRIKSIEELEEVFITYLK